ncbi:extracellular matrix protein 1 [Petromyzon marinus]|uniref:extracellular matrix protein 1 n=1 Tax=Petromyzon marinus TaxID=7757 RepID=UPI003F6FB4F1
MRHTVCCVVVVVVCSVCLGGAASEEQEPQNPLLTVQQIIEDPFPGLPFSPHLHTHEGCLQEPPPSVPAVDFPAGRPSAENLESVCRAGRGLNLRAGVRAPASGHGWLVRRLDSLRRLERALERCCERGHGQLRCAGKAWERSMDAFCAEEAMVKARQHRCCVEHAARVAPRYACFAAEAPDPAYSLRGAHAAKESRGRHRGARDVGRAGKRGRCRGCGRRLRGGS